jgi:hypothetical protein
MTHVRDDTVDSYIELSERLEILAEKDPRKWYNAMRRLCQRDLYFLLTEVLDTRNWMHPEKPGKKLFHDQFILDLCREIQFTHTDRLIVVPRGYGKSTIATLCWIIWILLNNPNATVGVFSSVKDIAETFVARVREEIEKNELLKALFPDRFWPTATQAEKESPRWTTDKGFTIKRPRIFNDQSVRPFGLADSSFASRRFSHVIYDDTVTEKTVTHSDMISKINDKWEKSLNCGFPGTIRLAVGTFYAGGDTYHWMVENGVQFTFNSCYEIDHDESRFSDLGIPRTLVVDRDKPILFSAKYLRDLERKQPRNFPIQMLGCPTALEVAEFRYEDFKWYGNREDPAKDIRKSVRHEGNCVLLVDPAKSKGTNKHSYFSLAVWVLLKNRRLALVDGVIDRLNLQERANILFEKVIEWEPYEVRYENLSAQADIDYINEQMELRRYDFSVIQVKGNLSKNERVEWLIPPSREGRILLPRAGINYLQKETGEYIDVVQWWMDKELLAYPHVEHLDFSDCSSRLFDPTCSNRWPRGKPQFKEDRWREMLWKDDAKPGLDWMAQ